MSTQFRLFSYAACGFFAFLAAGGFLHLITLPPSRADAVLVLFSNREVLLMACLFEAVIAGFLFWQPSQPVVGVLVIDFSACASLYQVGLIVQGEPSCGCLGVASAWFAKGTDSIAARIILVFFGVYGIYLLRHARKSLGISQPVARIAIVTTLAIVSLHPALAHASNIKIEGEFRCISWGGAPGHVITNFDTRIFHASAGESAMKVSFVVQRTKGACEVFVNKQVTARVQRYNDIADTLMAIWSPDYTWKLGNCGDGLTSWVVLMVRGSELFKRPPDSGIRRLSSTCVSQNEPLSLVTEGHYSYQDGLDGLSLICNVTISGSLKKEWKDDGLLSPSFLAEKELPIQQALLDMYPDQFVVEAMRFSQFTNIGGLEFPMLAESTVYKPSRTHSAPEIEGAATALIRVAITNVENGQVEEPSILPVTGPVMLSEHRLTDRDLHLELAHYHTQDVASFEITDAARAAFDSEKNKARSMLKANQKKWYLTAALIAVFFGVPVFLVYVEKRKGRAFKT